MAREIFQLTKEEVVQIAPGITGAYGAWGREKTNGDLEAICLEKDRPLVAATRFITRHHPYQPTPFLENRGMIGREMIGASVKLGRQALEANGWQGADYLYAATSSAPDETGEWANEVAGRLDIQNIRLSYLACNGGGAALFDSCQKPELADKKVLTIATEALGYFADPEIVADLTIFGNGAVALAYKPRQIRFINGKTVIIHDEEGVIRSPKTYHLPPVQERIKAPEWYEIRDGSEEVFAYSEKGVFMSLPKTNEGNQYMRMDGKGTARYFKYLVLDIQGEILKGYYEKNTEPIKICISHQPSGVVNRHNARELSRWLKSEGLPIIPEDNGVPWVMDKVGMGNASSATSLIAFITIAPTLRPGQRFLFTSYGAGAAVTVGVAQIVI